MVKNQIVKKWYDKVNQVFSALDTGTEHEIIIKREAIPLVFVPGIMGSVLRRKGTIGKEDEDGPDGLSNMRWNPSSSYWMSRKYWKAGPTFRKKMLVGQWGFSEDYLEVNFTKPVGNGFNEVSKNSYGDFLKFLQNQSNWGELTRIFDFPVFAFGYNWTDTNKNNGKKLAQRINEIKDEAKKVTGNDECKYVILITHSMGGLVSRAASCPNIGNAESQILGIIHGVQPVTGASAAYWRVKAGFEWPGLGIISWASSGVLGDSGRKVTPVLGSIPGGLELLPNKEYTDNGGRKQWLIVTEDEREILALPKDDPYKEIYEVQGTGNEIVNSGRKYWGLMDPELLGDFNPDLLPNLKIPSLPDNPNSITIEVHISGWDNYRMQLNIAKEFHELLKNYAHKLTYTFCGIDNKTADRVVMISKSAKIKTGSYYHGEKLEVERDSGGDYEHYPVRGFSARYVNNGGQQRDAIIQNPTGEEGDGTVPVSSANRLYSKTQRAPNPFKNPFLINIEHEPAFKNNDVREFVRKSVIALCVKRYEEKMGNKLNI